VGIARIIITIIITIIIRENKAERKISSNWK